MLPDKELIQRVSRKAHEYDKYSGCSQSVLLSLQEEFGNGNNESFKSATVFGGGVGYQGETCGALIGALMALGLVIGREKIEDTETYRVAMKSATEICNRFKEELQSQLGFSQSLTSNLCKEIQQNLYGRSFNMTNEEDYQAFLDAGGHSDKGCPRVCAIAAQVAAEKILQIRIVDSNQ
jgi:C_GCAxxG_C_C family probable redox protein